MKQIITLVLLLTFGYTCYAQPANDDCSTATAVSVPLSSSLEDGTGNTGGSLSCGGLTLNDGVWYSFMGTDSNVDITVSPGTWDPEIALFSGVCGSLTCIEQKDVAGTGGLETLEGLYTASGTTYYLVVGHYNPTNTENGTFSLSIESTAPSNDECTNATELSCGTTISNETTNLSSLNGPTQGCNTGKGIWYSYEGLGNEITIEVLPEAGYNVELNITSSTDCTAFTSVACVDDNTNGVAEIYTFFAAPETTYYFYVGHQASSTGLTGNFDISLSCTPPDNDDCSTATAISLPLSSSENGAGNTGGSLICNASLNDGVWYTFVGNGSKLYATVNPDNWDPEIALFSGDCANLTCVTQADIGFVGEAESLSNISTVSGTTYYLVVGHYNSANESNGLFTLDIEFGVPSNDACVAAIELDCGDILLHETTDSTTLNGPTEGCNTGNGVWYSYEGQDNETTISVLPEAGYNVELNITSSTDCTTFTNVACVNDSASGVEESYTFVAVSGTTYYFYVGHQAASSGLTGAFDISLSCKPPANNECSNATPLVCGTSLIGETTDFATANGSGTGCSLGKGVWYSYAGTGELATVVATGFALEISVSSSTDCTTFTNVGCEDNANTTGTETFTFLTESDSTYYIYIAYYFNGSDITGDFDISIECPTCSDGIQNGDETGIDCGGAFCSPCLAPANDLCVNATPLICGTSLVGETTVNSTGDGTNVGCDMGRGVWYSYAGTGELATVIASGFGLEISVSSSTDCTTFTNVGCEDSANSIGTESFTFLTESDSTYYIYIGYYSSGSETTGDFDIAIECPSCSDGIQNGDEEGVDCGGAFCSACPVPANDLCINATPLTCGTSLVGETTIHSTVNGADTGCYMGRGVWYSYAGTGELATVVASGFDLEISVSSSTDCITFTNVGCEDSTLGEERFTFLTETDSTYYIYIAYYTGANGTTSDFNISIECPTCTDGIQNSDEEAIDCGGTFCSPCPVPANDLCINATPLTCGTSLVGETTVASTANGADTGCDMGRGVWYSYAGTGELATVIASGFSLEISVSSSTDCVTFTNVGCEDNSYSTGTETFTFLAELDSTYYIYIAYYSSFGDTTGDFDISIDCPTCTDGIQNGDEEGVDCGGTYCDACPVPTNDLCSNATELVCGTSLTGQSTASATANGGDTGCSLGKGVWYSFTGNGASAKVTVSGFDVEISISTTTDCVTFNNVGCRDLAIGTEIFTFLAELDSTYYIYIAHYNANTETTGIFDIAIDCTPINDECSTATAITCGDRLTDQLLNNTTDNGDDTGCAMGTGAWYTYTGDDKFVKVTVIPNENFNPKFTISSSMDCTTFSPLQCVDNDSIEGGVESSTFYANSGTTYYIYVGDHDDTGISTGDFGINVDCYNCDKPTNANVEPTTTSALITWDAGNVSSTAYQVKYRLKGDTNWLTLGATTTQRNIPNLTAKKYYQYKVREKCSDNTWSDFTEIETFYTSACDAPTGVASIYLDDTRMRVRWDNNPEEIKGKIRYRVVGFTDWITQNSQDGQNFLYVNGFPSGATTVQYKVRSNCDGNDWSEYSPLMEHYLGSVTRLVEEEKILATSNIYPNPTKNELNIEFETKDEEEVSIMITDNLGQTIHFQNNTYGQGMQKETLDVERLSNGYYFVTIQSNERMETKKFMKMD